MTGIPQHRAGVGAGEELPVIAASLRSSRKRRASVRAKAEPLAASADACKPSAFQFMIMLGFPPPPPPQGAPLLGRASATDAWT